jgi:hypothetical protein
MKMRTGLTICGLAVCILCLAAAQGMCKDYVVMLSRNINVRTGPSTNRVSVARAWKGDIFEGVGEDENWFEIVMFSGESRYVSRSWAADLKESDLVDEHGMRLPSAETQWDLCRDIRAAKARAKGEADEILPASVDEQANRNLIRILEDRFILEVFAVYSVQPALYGDLMDEMGGEGCGPSN